MKQTTDTPRCMHCGNEHGLKRNWWVGGWECRLVRGGVPECIEGQQWYGENTRVRDDWTREYVGEPCAK